MLDYVWVGLGGALGSMARFAVANLAGRWWGASFPYGTLFVNVTGSFLVGFLATCTTPNARWPMGPEGRFFLMAGICGGYTTFSSFSLQTFNLMREGHWLHAGLNTLGSFLGCLLAVWLGHLVALGLSPGRTR